ncbi:toxic anion resistance protein [Clostridium botulinum]|uniref:Toxic anion resistance protein, tela family n=1 Tax=Clostridium botulinum D str. 1873 TaxID=592027 RepID=A0A9P2G8V8_CLOBO|nr:MULTISPECIES: toxic anion resistance protein [Clostridium]EES92089.1 toxic anion resistance protein, tela family [Clostridium botulinum D str. 1873]MBO3442669.1 toxic anion resistance protein [Clostridium haemolyticum]MCD3216803.1 toxic anion resistance protein [Clostridium botulinum C]MCD3245615.1 toxic anion resistance protein [Clostridium botulinum C]MCD3261994.1 toxic anion resistance protein [Clostridium botulinum C]
MNENSVITTQFSEINLEKETNDISLKVKNSPEVLDLAKKLDIYNVDSVMNFGQDTATEISRFADQILNSIETTKVEDSGTLLVQLNKIMDKFDIKDFEEKKQGFFAKIFKKAQDSIDALFKKYHTMGGEIDKVYIELKKYESEINTSNKNLEEMFNKNMDYYESLEKYIQAGNLVVANFKNKILPELQLKADNSTEQINQINLSNAMQILEMIEQRIYDLELAKNVALQTMPQIKLIQKGNYNLVRKINSAFIVTIPVFKQCLTQAITLKRQAVQAKAMAALDEKTNELLLRNAENTALQSKLTAKLASGSSIQIETLEKTWSTIVQGIEETKQIELDAKKQREDGTKRLHELQKDFESRTRQ